MSSNPVQIPMVKKEMSAINKREVTPTNHQEDSDDDHSYVSEPDEAQKRYAALRNHQIRFCDAIDPNAERVHHIRDIDIVLGRGRGFQNHAGNQRMRAIIENYKTRYHSLSRMEKRKLVEQVYEKVVTGGARFLKKLDDEDAWVVVDLPIALQKVSHTMRCRKSIHKQLDANGRLPMGVGGPPLALQPSMNRKKAPQVSRLPPGMAAPMGASHLGGIPRIVSTGDPLGANSALAAKAAVGVPPSATAVSSLGGLPQPGLGSLGGLGRGFPPSAAAAAAMPSMAELEAQHLAAQRRYRSISGMSAESRMDYLEEVRRQQEMRRQQIIRETQMYTRMGDALLMNPATGAAPAPGISPLGTTPGLMPSMHHHHAAAAAGFPAAAAAAFAPTPMAAGLAPTPMTAAEVELAARMAPGSRGVQQDPRFLASSSSPQLVGAAATKFNPSVVQSATGN